MAKNVEIGLDVSSLISDYRAAISAMESAGAKANITQGLTKSLDKLEQQFKDLSNEGAFGKTNAKDIANYQGRVDKVYSSLGQLGTELERIAKDKQAFPASSMAEFEKKLEEARQKALDLQNALTKKLESFGLSGDLKEALQSEESLKSALKTELEERQKIEQAAKAALAADQEAANIARKAGSTGRGANAVSSDMMNTSYGGFSSTELKTIRQDLNATFAQLIRQGEDFETVWEKGIENSLLGTEKELNDFIVDVERLKVILQEVIDKRDQAIAGSTANQNYSAAVAAREQIGDSSGGEIHFSESTLTLINEITAGMQQLSEEESNIINIESQRNSVEKEAANVEQILDSATRNLSNATEESRTQFDQNAAAIYNTQKNAEELSASFDQMASRVRNLLSIGSVFTMIKNVIKSTYNDVKALDKSFASIAMVTDQTVSGLWGTYDDYAAMASKLGQSTNDVIQASALFYQQGLDTAEALTLTEDTMKLATLAGNDFQTATSEMTAALRGFKMEMDEGGHVTDVYSELAAHAAASVDDIALAMQRTASIANSAGMSFENTSAFLTQMIETTQESAENIGTSMKTIIARFTELKDNVAGTADSEFDDLDFNKVDKALKSVGVSLKDTSGQFRNLDEVFLELSSKWDSLDRNTQRYVATIAAGSRQQSRFIAMMDNYDRTVELMETAADAEGKADEQFAKYADTMEYKLNQLSTTWEQFRVDLMNTDLFNPIIEKVTEFVQLVNSVDFHKFSGKAFAAEIAIMAIAIKNFVVNFIKSVSTTVKTAKELGSQIVTNFVTGIKKNISKSNKLSKLFIIDPQLRTKFLELQLKDSEKKIFELNKKISDSEESKILIKTNIDPTGYQNAKEYIQKYRETLREAGATEEEIGLASEQLRKELEAIGPAGEGADGGLKKLQKTSEEEIEAIKELNSELDIYQNNQNEVNERNAKTAQTEAVASAATSLLSSAINSGAAALAGYASGAMTASEAIKMFIGSMVSMIAQMALQIVMTAAKSAAVKKANAEEAASYWSLFVAEMAAYWPLLLIIGAIAFVAAAVIGLIALFSKENKSLSETEKAQQAYNEALEDAATAKEHWDDAKSDSNSLKQELKNAQKMKQEWEELEELRKRGALTTEQEERRNELAGEITETYPDIVKYYNEETGALELQNDLWDKKIERMETAAKAQKDAADQSAEVYYEAEKNRVEAEAELNKKQLGVGRTDFVKGYDQDGNKIYGNLSEGMAYELKYNKKDEGDKGGESYKDFASQYAADNNLDLTALLKTVGQYDVDGNYDIATMTDADWEHFVEQIKNGGDELENALLEAAKGIDSAAQEEADYYNDLIINNRAQDLSDSWLDAEGNKQIEFDAAKMVQESIADSVANMNTIDFTYTDDQKKKGDVQDFDWDQLTEVQKQQATQAGYIEETFNDLDLSKESDRQKLQDAYDAAQREQYSQDLGEQVANQMKESGLLDSMNKMVLDGSTMTQDELQKQLDLMTSQLEGMDLDETTKANLQQQIEDYKKQQMIALNEQKDNLRNLIGDSQYADQLKKNTDGEIYLGDWDAAHLEAFNAQLNAIADTYGDLAAADYGAQILASAEKMNLDQDQVNKVMSVDWSQVTAENEEEFREATIKQWKEAGIAGAEELYDQAHKIAKEEGMVDLTINTEGLEEFQEKLDDLKDNVQSLGDDIVSAVEDLHEAGEISFDNFESLSDNLKELGLNVYDYVNIDDNGKITASEEQLEQLYKDQLAAQQEKLKTQINENNAKIAELNTTITQLQTQREIVAAGGDSYDMTMDNYEGSYQWALVMQDIAKSYDRIRGIESTDYSQLAHYSFDISGDNQQALLDAMDSEILALTTQMEDLQSATDTLQEQYDNDNLWQSAALRNFNQEMYEAKGITTDVASAQEDYNKALEDYNDQLETVAEKQEALNEKLEAYNDLLYGSDNRKSTLDYFYNYDEAINSFNDEISRAQDLLSNASSIDEATEALSRYASATHNLIAEETAKQQVLQAGLANYADKIEHGSYSYTNQETGEVTNINFGDYARKDERTGKYVIDQRLINESRFGDEWKDLLEEQVSNYNKYSEDLLASEDNVRKAEKALRDERENALKNYVALEDKVKEVLKAEYQEQVDNLTNMYDSMKEADDDYVNALQDAIDKQRALREQENAWEDLAQKEKKLSLMQRDTSGANQVETMKLEEEVQDDREKLLDDAIDNIIEGLSDLYESQSELRDAELELKEALLENDAYWAGLSEATVQGFTDLDDATEWYLQHSLELTDMTAAGAEADILSFQDTYGTATEYMAMQLMDETSETGDFINDAINVSGEEAMMIIAETSETFTTEAQRAFDETQATFEADMEKAEQDIRDAKDALQEAVDKLGELAEAARLAAIEYENAKAAKNELDNITNDIWDNGNEDTEDNKWASATSLYGIVNALGVDHNALDDISKKMDGNEESFAMIRTLKGHNITTEQLEKVMELSGLSPAQIGYEFGLNGNAVSEMTRNVSEEEQRHRVANALITGHKFAEGGLVDYTGPAWVDGTASRPEAFLSADDTERIGNAARILADIPWIDRDTDNSTVVTNNGGDVSVEINLNIDHISSDTDIDDMIERVKEEIVEVARPTGTNVILQQQL